MIQRTFIFFVLFLTGCGQFIYTIKNNYTEPIMAGGVTVAPNQCLELVDVPVIGDFPIKFKDKKRRLFSSDSYPPGHYAISPKGEILEQETACEIEILREQPAPDGE